MDDINILEHANGAPGFRYFGLGPNFKPSSGLKQLQTLLTNNSSWGQKRNIKDLKKMLAGSSVVVSFWSHDQLIGFGRATTDQIYRAVLWDIVVEKNYQNLGLGKKIVKKLVMNPMIYRVQRIYVMTTHCETFYGKVGFQSFENQKLMIYQRSNKN
jgi:N-acetylglutamate synthase-like GNAT family acetyltransferase